MKLTPTPSQQVAVDDFFSFLMSDASVFVLSGGAGVGKTFLMGHISNDVMQTYQDSCKLLGIPILYETLTFTATTNKAAEVLEESLGVPVQTIQSFLGLKVKENWKTGKTTLEKTANYKLRKGHIIFIDECSMIDMALYKIILETFSESKIVFVGDHAQMAPVNEDGSQVFMNIDEQNFIHLDEPVRNSGSPALMNLCDQLRQTVVSGVFAPIVSVPGSIEYLDEQQMITELDNQFKNTADPSCRILCYTNSRVESYNEYIREIRNLPTGFQPGDLAVVAQTYAVGQSTLNVEREVEIVSVDPQIHDAGYSEFFVDAVPVQFHEAKITSPRIGVEPITVNLPVSKERWRLAIKELARQKRWGDYFELKGLCLDLRDKAACTVYKSQGSTYESVFIDLGNIGTSFDAKQVARMLFVAASRATTKVFLHGRLPAMYCGKLAA